MLKKSTSVYALAALSTLIVSQLAVGQDEPKGSTKENVAPTVPAKTAVAIPYQDGLAAMLAKAGTGKARVIFTLSSLGTNSQGKLASERASFDLSAKVMAAGRDRLMQAMQALGIAELRQSPNLPLISATVDAVQLKAIAASGLVAAMEEDIIVYPTLAQSVPLINAPAVWAVGNNKGQNQIVAVLDTGVMAGHNFLTGKVAAEACFSTNGTVSGTTYYSLCPGGVTSSTATGSAAPCSVAGAACWHGTHVAGIAVGKQNGSTTFNGVAPEAKLLAIKVFSGVTTGGISGTGLDILSGLQHVKLKKQQGMKIVSANLSLGGGAYTTYCGGSAETLIGQLRAMNVATVISSGNNSYTNAVGWPACSASAITVGSSTKTNTISTFSNFAPMIDLLAPGTSINSSVTSTSSSYGLSNGTSMAAPHVAGAIALLLPKTLCGDISTLEAKLKATGLPITHPTTGAVYPRIDLQAALTQLVAMYTPPPLNSPC